MSAENPKSKRIEIQLPEGGIIQNNSAEAAQLAVKNLNHQIPTGGILKLSKEEREKILPPFKGKALELGVNLSLFNKR